MATVTIASIWPLPLVEERGRNLHQKKFALPAAKRGEVHYLKVENDEQSEYVGNGKSWPRTIPAIDIANDLVKCWTENIPTGKGGRSNDPAKAKPGIWVCAGDTATPEEIADADAKQRELARVLVLYADGLWSEPKTKDWIMPLHREMAKLIEVQDREWLEGTDRSAVDVCPFCYHKSPKGVVTCGNCKEILDHEQYAKLKQRVKQEGVGALQKEIRQQRNRNERIGSLGAGEAAVQEELEEAMAEQAAPKGR